MKNDPTTSLDQAIGSTAGPRRVAEWVSLGLSIALILATASYLVVTGLRGQSDSVPVEVRVLTDQQKIEGARIVLPVEIRNVGRQTIHALTGEVRFTPAGAGEEEAHEFTIDYLGVGAREKIFVYLDRDPRGAEVRAKPLTYQVD